MSEDLSEIMKGHVTGLGGIFFKCPDADASKKWYHDTLGIPVDEYGINFKFREDHAPDERGYNILGMFGDQTDYFGPSDKDFMINLRVRDLDGMVEKLRNAGIPLEGEPESHDYGKFAWIIDPNGVKLELWEQVGSPPE